MKNLPPYTDTYRNEIWERVAPIFMPKKNKEQNVNELRNLIIIAALGGIL